jgi:predicted house-cleaning noncanonical NTP pyrophosphatase (MazG superfamily)
MKKEIDYDKLVRDRIPEIIEKSGKEFVIHKASDEEYKTKLLEKVVEELEEFKEKPCEEEIADILEVIDSIIDYYGFDKEKIEVIQGQKRNEQGGFKEKVILEKVLV